MIKNPSRVRATQDREAAEESRSPVILQASAGARKYAGEAYLRHMVLAAVESHPTNPLVLHQDHDASLVVCTQSIRSGFTSGVRKVNIDTEAFGCAGHADRMRPVPLEAMVKRYH